MHKKISEDLFFRARLAHLSIALPTPPRKAFFIETLRSTYHVDSLPDPGSLVNADIDREVLY
jgi:hypothetical protein